MKSHLPEQLREIYRRKVLNQELALKEFAERKTILLAKPSKLMLELGEHGQPPMRPDIFSKVSGLFEHAYFADLRGLDHALCGKGWEKIVEQFEHHPLINFHSVTHLQLDNAEVWRRLSGVGLMFGVFMRAASEKTAKLVVPHERFDWVMKNMEIISTSLSDSKRGFMYMIVLLQQGSFHEMPRFIEIAKRFGIPEVQFKIITTVDQIERSFPIDGAIVTEALDAAINLGVRVTLNDQDLMKSTDPEKVIRASKAPYDPILNFPPRDLQDREFEREHGWRGIDTKVLERSKVSVYQKCFKPFHYFHVRRDGSIGPCNHLMSPPVDLGTFQKNTFEEIWNGTAYQAFRAQLLARKSTDPRCQWCFKHRLED